MKEFLLENHEKIKNILTSLAILIGGIWTFWRFVLQREGNAKIQFDLDLRVIGILKNEYIIEIIAIVENKGTVRHYVNDFKFDLLYLSDKHEIVDGDERINHQLLFEKKIEKRYWIPPLWYTSFIDAGVIQKYTYVSHLPVDAVFATIYAQFKYPSFSRYFPLFRSFHTSQKTFKLKLQD
jgi:hypothetical protein